MSARSRQVARTGALGLLHAALFSLAFPPFGAWALVFVALWPLARIAESTDRPARSALVVWAATLPIWLFHERWVAAVTVPGYPALCAYLSLYPAAFVWIGGRLQTRFDGPIRRAVALSVVWTGLEMLRGRVVFDGYAWFLLGHPLIELPVRGLAAVGGVYLVSLVVAAISLLAWEAVRSRRRGDVLRTAGLSGLLLGASFGVGFAALRTGGRAGEPARSLRIAAVQTNVAQDNKIAWSPEERVEDYQRFIELTDQAAETEPAPDVIVWPETMFPGFTLSPPAVTALREKGIVFGGRLEATVFNEALTAFQDDLGVSMLVGAEAYEGFRVEIGDGGDVRLDYDARFNSVFLVEAGRVAPTRYDKLHLTPFGEVMPYISWSDWLEEQLLAIGAPGMSFDLATGDRPVVFRISTSGGAEARVATPICFEAASPRTCRRLVFADGGRRADVLVNVTNDGWFGAARGGRAQHLQAGRWRCVELATPMVRAANTGISAAIDARGRLIQAGPDDRQQSAWVDGVMTASVRLPPPDGRTVYARIGDAVGWLTLAGLVGVVGWTLLRSERR